MTEADCSRYGLTLVKATFSDFLSWLKDECPILRPVGPL